MTAHRAAVMLTVLFVLASVAPMADVTLRKSTSVALNLRNLLVILLLHSL